MCILSNTNKLEKVTTVANKARLTFLSFCKSSMKSGFKKHKNI